jgi:hypothetical protein
MRKVLAALGIAGFVVIWRRSRPATHKLPGYMPSDARLREQFNRLGNAHRKIPHPLGEFLGIHPNPTLHALVQPSNLKCEMSNGQ